LLHVPPELHAIPRTIFASGTRKHYDQLAWFTGTSGGPSLSFQYTGRAGFVDFRKHLMSNEALSNMSLSYRISDHFPLWVEFQV
jgi:hypothetical protein